MDDAAGADGNRPDLPGPGLTGRDGDLDFLRGFFGQALVSGGALLLTGDPGVGKTALLDALADGAAAAGTMVLRVAGAEFEGDVSFSGLNQALFPLVGEFGELGAALREVHREVDPHVIENVTASAMYADRLAEFREPLWRTVQRGRDGGPARKQITALVNLCFDDFFTGNWAEAVELAAEGLRVSEERGGRFFGWCFRYLQALLAAVQGRFDTSRTLASQVIGWAAGTGRCRTSQ